MFAYNASLGDAGKQGLEMCVLLQISCNHLCRHVHLVPPGGLLAGRAVCLPSCVEPVVGNNRESLLLRHLDRLILCMFCSEMPYGILCLRGTCLSADFECCLCAFACSLSRVLTITHLPGSFGTALHTFSI